MFRSLSSNDFPPLGKFVLDFPPVKEKPVELAEVHLLTGVNGTGKTRLLAVLAAMLGNPAPLQKRMRGVAQPRILNIVIDGHPDQKTRFNASQSSGGWHVAQPADQEVIQWCRDVPAFAYHGGAYVCDSNVTVMAKVVKPDRALCLSFSRPEGYSPTLLQAITNLKMQATMEAMDEGANATQARSTVLIQTLEATLTEITGKPFRFHVSPYPQPGLSVKWAGTYLPFDVLPDGLRSIIGWMVDSVVTMDAWFQGKGDLMNTNAVFLLDEVESHLHPVWQRRILPAFQHLFPNAQIIVATHSPFVISSLNHGWIHRLILHENGIVTVEQPMPASAGDSYISVLEDIMGVNEWYDPETEQLLEKFRAQRDRAYQGDHEAKASAVKLAGEIGKRSMELGYIMGKELSQMDRQLAKAQAK